MADQLRKRHHYRPALHLRHFAGPDHRLWVYHRAGERTAQRAAPESIGYTKFLYAPGEGSPDPRSDAFERWLERFVDGPAAPALNRAAAGEEVLETRDRLALARLIVAQDIRTPVVRDLLLRLFQRGLEAGWKEVVAESLAALQMDTGPEAVDAVSETYTPRVTNAAWLDFLRSNIASVAHRLAGRPWTVLTAPANYDWLTSDIGILKFSGGFEHPTAPGPGWTPNRDHWLFPVSPRVALAIAPLAAPARAEARPAWLKMVNHRITLDANHFVAARSRSDFVIRWWRQESSSAV